MNIKKNIAYFQNLTKSGNCKLIAVSKTKPAAEIMLAYEAGQRIFGENRAQELESKSKELPKDIEWHMIGHLQTNKVKYIAPFVSMIQSADSVKLCGTINNEAIKFNRIIPVLLQIHVAQEESKFGFSREEILQSLKNNEFKEFKNIQVKGLMAMATLTDDQEIIRREFRSIKDLFNEIKFMQIFPEFSEVSMGMTNDFKIAMEEGSTMIRIGSAIFGERSNP